MCSITPIKDYIIHIDLHEIAQDEILHAEVPVTSVGEPLGVKTGGGLLETMLRTIRVACLPRDLPDLITVDVSHLEIGHSVHVSELKLPEGVKASNPPELPVFSVFAPKEEVVEAPTAEVGATGSHQGKEGRRGRGSCGCQGWQAGCEGCPEGRREEVVPWRSLTAGLKIPRSQVILGSASCSREVLLRGRTRATELPGQVRSQVQLGNEGKREFLIHAHLQTHRRTGQSRRAISFYPAQCRVHGARRVGG